MIRGLFLGVICLWINSTMLSQPHPDTLVSVRQAILFPKKATDLPRGYRFYTKQKDYYLKIGDTIAAVDAMRMLAIAAFKIGDLTESEIQSVEALQYITHFNSKPDLVPSRLLGLYNQLGRLYEDKELYNQALSYYESALTVAASLTDSMTIVNNRGNVYRALDNYQNAIADYQWVIQRANSINDTITLARSINNYGAVLSAQNDNEALPVLLEGLRLRQLKNSKEGVFGSYRHLVHHFQAQNEIFLARQYAKNCLIIAKELNSPAYLREAYSMLLDLSDDETVLEYKILTDSLNEANREVQNLYAAMRFNVNQEKLVSQRAKSQLEQERSEKRLTLLIGALIVLLLILVILFILYRMKHIKQREVFITESRISKKVHDEVANEVYQLMVKMQLKQASSEDWLDDLESIYNRSRDISKEFNTIDTSVSYQEVLLDLLASYQSDNLRVLNRNVSKYPWQKLSQAQKNGLFRVLQELLTNMKKHSEATLVVVSVRSDGKKTEIKFTDNGVGTVLKKQNGLQNAENRIFALKGSITFETEPGKGFQAKILM